MMLKDMIQQFLDNCNEDDFKNINAILSWDDDTIVAFKAATLIRNERISLAKHHESYNNINPHMNSISKPMKHSHEQPQKASPTSNQPLNQVGQPKKIFSFPDIS